MSVTQLQHELAALRAFKYPPLEWAEGKPEEGARKLIKLVARFGHALGTVGLNTDLIEQAKKFDTLAGEGSAFQQAYRVAWALIPPDRPRLSFAEVNLMQSSRPLEDPPSPEVSLCNTGLELIEGINLWLPGYDPLLFPGTIGCLLTTLNLTQGKHALWQHSQEFCDWQNALFQLAVIEEREHPWGSSLILQCQKTLDAADYAAYAGLAKQLESLEGPLVAMLAAAEFWTQIAGERQEKTKQTSPPDSPPPKPVVVPEGGGSTPEQILAGLDPKAMLTHTDLAKRLKLNSEQLRKRLDRWRAEHPGDGWHEVTERKHGRPKYIYCVSAILDVLRGALGLA